MTLHERVRADAVAAGSAWQRFWFTPVSSSVLAMFRVAFGILVVLWTVTLLPSIDDFYGPGAIAPGARVDLEHGVWSLVTAESSVALATAVAVALLGAAIALAAGYRTRFAAVIVFIGVLSLTRHPYITNAGDGLLRVIAFYAMLAPLGASFSLDRRRKDREGWCTPVPVSSWALRLIQLQLSCIYFFSVWHKVRTDAWSNGTALSTSLRIEDVARFPVPDFVAGSPSLGLGLTYAALLTELSLAMLVWNRRARPYVLIAGIGMHLGIDYSMRVGFFSYTMIGLYLAFLAPATADAWAASMARRFSRAAAWLALRRPVARSSVEQRS